MSTKDLTLSAEHLKAINELVSHHSQIQKFQGDSEEEELHITMGKNKRPNSSKPSKNQEKPKPPLSSKSETSGFKDSSTQEKESENTKQAAETYPLTKKSHLNVNNHNRLRQSFYDGVFELNPTEFHNCPDSVCVCALPSDASEAEKHAFMLAYLKELEDNKNSRAPFNLQETVKLTKRQLDLMKQRIFIESDERLKFIEIVMFINNYFLPTQNPLGLIFQQASHVLSIEFLKVLARALINLDVTVNVNDFCLEWKFMIAGAQIEAVARLNSSAEQLYKMMSNSSKEIQRTSAEVQKSSLTINSSDINLTEVQSKLEKITNAFELMISGTKSHCPTCTRIEEDKTKEATRSIILPKKPVDPIETHSIPEQQDKDKTTDEEKQKTSTQPENPDKKDTSCCPPKEHDVSQNPYEQDEYNSSTVFTIKYLSCGKKRKIQIKQERGVQVIYTNGTSIASRIKETVLKYTLGTFWHDCEISLDGDLSVCNTLGSEGQTFLMSIISKALIQSSDYKEITHRKPLLLKLIKGM